MATSPSPPPPPRSLPSLADVIFSSEQANHNFSRILGDLKRANLSITNRLRSIRHDAAFVARVAAARPRLPLVANERCGSWYIDPALKAASAYFKSTDGHTGQWKFSTRRVNLHLLDLIAQHNGCIIVDSTRRGKRIPDALSKTVPIWCAVLNRALFPSAPTAWHALHVPPNVVSLSEQSQIEARLPRFVADFLALEVDLAPLQQRLRNKPLRPLWATQDDFNDDDDFEGSGSELEFYPVVCCTSSRCVAGGTEVGEGAGYIQGAGDDTENWALGLTAPLFWAHADALLTTPEHELPALIQSLVAVHTNTGVPTELRQVAPRLAIGVLPPEPAARAALTVASASGATTCVVALVPAVTDAASWEKSPSHLEVGLGGKSKAASRALRAALPQICDFVSRFLLRPDDDDDDDDDDGGGSSLGGVAEKRAVAIVCESGKDLSVGVALALYCWCFDSSGQNLLLGGDREPFTKTKIRVRLGHILSRLPDANPSRATLQSVNSFLID
ncbi:tRNA A64-2'-O-ribosylphosphate transferase [Lasiosphaeria miniovina]|uniref:tRNA A64-2'-O-ribosylphosphate transferase n=1 Tax=Lasiosphaeria miniovina TaxID=1954250 RepID=A0AA40B5K5_9PEZI|nr:tRNA A64-2'-O-ribosylphosphate transferase [Lasiosphaeria miniovina]KAK0728116.1 tRNA A64-2'-O-ribosylphosphate transferase [Lasiosphaeria miniovina]